MGNGSYGMFVVTETMGMCAGQPIAQSAPIGQAMAMARYWRKHGPCRVSAADPTWMPPYVVRALRRQTRAAESR